MVTLQKVYPSHFPKVLPLLENLNEKSVTVDHWRAMFEYDWVREEEHCGYGLFDGERIVGFMAMIFSRREIDGQTYSFCDTGSWIVEKGFRQHSYKMVRPLYTMKHHTLVDLHPSEAVYEMEKLIGFKQLDVSATILFPCFARERARWNNKVAVIQREDAIQDILRGDRRSVYNDHKKYACRQMVICDDRSYCHLVYTREYAYGIPYCYLYCTHDARCFCRNSVAIRNAILRLEKACFVAVDTRLLVGEQLPASTVVKLDVPTLYRSASLRPEQIDNLYTDLVVQERVNMPRIKSKMKAALRCVLPSGL